MVGFEREYGGDKALFIFHKHKVALLGKFYSLKIS